MGRNVVPIVLGVGAMFIPGAVAGTKLFALGAKKMAAAKVAGTKATLSAGESLAQTLGNMGALTAGAVGYAGGNAMVAPDIQQPDYGNMFQQQQGILTEQQSFGRKNTADLEGLLEFGSAHEKNLAFDELERRGEDSARLLEIQTRNERTAENQEDIDRYIEGATPPSDEEMANMIATLKATEYQRLEEDIDEEMTNVKQVMARRGLGSSNAISQLEARLAQVEHEGKLAIDKNVQDRVLSYQQGVQGIRNEGLTRMLKGAGFEDTASRYNLELGQQERNLQEGLRSSKVQQQNALGLEKFRAEVQGLNNKFVAEEQRRNTDAMLGLGAVGMSMMNRQGTETGGTGENIPYQQPDLSSMYTPKIPNVSFSGAGGFNTGFSSGLYDPKDYDFRTELTQAPTFSGGNRIS